jgi:hypothetical protein
MILIHQARRLRYGSEVHGTRLDENGHETHM